MEKKAKRSRRKKALCHPKIFAIDKPAGISSFDVIRKLKPHFGRVKIGHFGTLDPFASGLLLVGIGNSLRLMDFIHRFCPKSYTALGEIGLKTDSGDRDGQVLEERPFVEFDVAKWELSCRQDFLQKEYWQKMPVFSAAKHEGKALYEYVRQGVMIEKPPVKRVIHQLIFKGLDQEQARLQFHVRVETGTYIRQLFEDMCQLIDQVGHLRELRRTNIGQIDVDNAYSLERDGDKDLAAFEIELTNLLDFTSQSLNWKEIEDILHGRPISGSAANGEQYQWAKAPGERIVSLLERRDGRLWPKVNLFQLEQLVEIKTSENLS